MASPQAIQQWAGPRRLDRYRSLYPGQDGSAAPMVLRVAWAGRTSTYDQQDPTLSLPRQLRKSQEALPSDAVIVAHFYDIESGRKELAERGHGHAHEQFQIPIPRDGGIADLLEEASRRDRRFDAVICESIDRIARRAYIATEIEHQLEQAGVRLLAADEPITAGERGGKPRATQVLTRRLKQGVAEWYVIELLEKSWGGFEVHTEAGYNVGKPCYGYRALKVPHPVPAKRAKGVKKTRLEAHPVEGPVVRKMFTWRVTGRLGYHAIADRLNADLATNPPPVPVDPTRATGRWTYSNVRDVLTNPKYTGHMVWNRRARKGAGKNRVNPVTEWVWSPEPVHEALIDLETYVQAQEVAGQRERSRTSPGANRHPAAKNVYRLRSYLVHAGCGRRMTGRTFRGTAYYVCAPKPGYVPPGHNGAASAYLREDHLLDGLSEFLATRVFGSYRENLLDASLRELDDAARHDHQRQVTAVRRAISDNEARSKRLLRNFELVEEPDQELIKDINARRAELRAERAHLNDQLADLQEQTAQAPNPELLARLPVTPVDLTGMPDEVSRQLFEALRLEMVYDHERHQVAARVTLTGDTIDTVSRTTQAVVLPFRPRAAQPAADAPNPHGSAWCPQRDSNPCRRLERAMS
jgi:site-specific DNA recombinase